MRDTSSGGVGRAMAPARPRCRLTARSRARQSSNDHNFFLEIWCTFAYICPGAARAGSKGPAGRFQGVRPARGRAARARAVARLQHGAVVRDRGQKIPKDVKNFWAVFAQAQTAEFRAVSLQRVVWHCATGARQPNSGRAAACRPARARKGAKGRTWCAIAQNTLNGKKKFGRGRLRTLENKKKKKCWPSSLADSAAPCLVLCRLPRRLSSFLSSLG